MSCWAAVKSVQLSLTSMKRDPSPLWPCFCLPPSVVSACNAGTLLLADPLALALFYLRTLLFQGPGWVVNEAQEGPLLLLEGCNKLCCSLLQETRCKPKSKQKRYCLFQRRDTVSNLAVDCWKLGRYARRNARCCHYFPCWKQDSCVGGPLVLLSMAVLMFL